MEDKHLFGGHVERGDGRGRQFIAILDEQGLWSELEGACAAKTTAEERGALDNVVD